MSSRRLFANNNNNSFNDYNNKKKEKEILKNLNTKEDNRTNSYPNYETFLNASKSRIENYTSMNNEQNGDDLPQSIYESKNKYIYNDILENIKEYEENKNCGRNSRRLFANSSEENFNDRNNLIKGNEILKNIKSKGINSQDSNCVIVNNEITYFTDYETFLNVSKAHFKHYSSEDIDEKSPQSIFESKHSYIFGENIEYD